MAAAGLDLAINLELEVVMPMPYSPTRMCPEPFRTAPNEGCVLPPNSALLDPALLSALDTLSGDGQHELRLLQQENMRLLAQLQRRRPDLP